MKNLLFLFWLLFFNFCIAQTVEETADFFKSENDLVTSKIEVETSEGEKFEYIFGTAQFSSKEIQQKFHIPASIASKFPMQVIYLKDFSDMSNISPKDIIGISAFSINPEIIKHSFFRNEKINWKEDEFYRTTFNNSIFCSFCHYIFNLEIANTNFTKNNPAYFLIYNKDIEFNTKNEQERFVSQGYFALLGMPDQKNPLFLKLKKQADTLGFTHKRLDEKEGVSRP